MTWTVKTKKCKICSREKNRDQYRVIGKLKTGEDKLHPYCDVCKKDYNTAVNKKYRERKRVNGVVKVKKTNSGGKDYLQNKELHCELIVSIAAGRLTRPAANMIYLISKGVNRKFYYERGEDREDALQTGLFDALKNWMQYDPDKTHNAFAYITEIVKRGHAKYYNEMIKHSHLRLDVLYDDGDGWDRI